MIMFGIKSRAKGRVHIRVNLRERVRFCVKAKDRIRVRKDKNCGGIQVTTQVRAWMTINCKPKG